MLTGKDEKIVTVRLHACPAPGLFKPSRFYPSKNNVRTAWFMEQSTPNEGRTWGWENTRLLGSARDCTQHREVGLLQPCSVNRRFVVGSNVLSSPHTGVTEPPTPHYNNSILCDTVLLSHLQFLSSAATDFPGMKDGLALLKVWLNQRQLSKVCPVPGDREGSARLANAPLACFPFLGVERWWIGPGGWCGGLVTCVSCVRFQEAPSYPVVG